MLSVKGYFCSHIDCTPCFFCPLWNINLPDSKQTGQQPNQCFFSPAAMQQNHRANARFITKQSPKWIRAIKALRDSSKTTIEHAVSCCLFNSIKLEPMISVRQAADAMWMVNAGFCWLRHRCVPPSFCWARRSQCSGNYYKLPVGKELTKLLYLREFTSSGDLWDLNLVLLLLGINKGKCDNFRRCTKIRAKWPS